MKVGRMLETTGAVLGVAAAVAGCSANKTPRPPHSKKPAASCTLAIQSLGGRAYEATITPPPLLLTQTFEGAEVTWGDGSESPDKNFAGDTELTFAHNYRAAGKFTVQGTVYIYGPAPQPPHEPETIPSTCQTVVTVNR